MKFFVRVLMLSSLLSSSVFCSSMESDSSGPDQSKASSHREIIKSKFKSGQKGIKQFCRKIKTETVRVTNKTKHDIHDKRQEIDRKKVFGLFGKMIKYHTINSYNQIDHLKITIANFDENDDGEKFYNDWETFMEMDVESHHKNKLYKNNQIKLMKILQTKIRFDFYDSQSHVIGKLDGILEEINKEDNWYDQTLKNIYYNMFSYIAKWEMNDQVLEDLDSEEDFSIEIRINKSDL